MSKYNNIKSIPIRSIKNKRLKKAIKEWAEGDNAMEELLWACYKNNIETTGCHAGSKPYIDFFAYNSREKIVKMLGTVMEINGSQFFVNPDGGNPFSGPDWYKPSITIGFDTAYKDEADICFNALTNKILSDNKELSSKDNFSYKILDLLDYFTGKESGLLFRFYHKDDGVYIFDAEWRQPNNKFNYFNNLFTKSGLSLDKTSKLENRKKWIIKDKDLDKIIKKSTKSINYILNNYSLGMPSTIVEIDNFLDAAHFNKREFGDTKKGRKKLNKWINIYKEFFIAKEPEQLLRLMNKYIHYGYLGRSGRIYHFDEKDFNDSFVNEYVLQGENKTLFTLCGTCWDQVELERSWFLNHKYEVKTIFEMVNLDYENNYPTHTFIIYKDKENYWNLFENADYDNRGIHKFKTFDELINYQYNIYVNFLKKFNIKDEEIDKIIIAEYEKPKSGIGVKEFLKHMQKSKIMKIK